MSNLKHLEKFSQALTVALAEVKQELNNPEKRKELSEAVARSRGERGFGQLPKPGSFADNVDILVAVAQKVKLNLFPEI